MSALKACVINGRGRVVARAQARLATRSPQPLWSEQSAGAWARALAQVRRDLAAQKTMAAHKITALSCTGGAHSAVLADAHGRARAPVIMWSDQRAQAEARALQRHARAFVARSWNRPNPTWTAAHLRWRHKHTPRLARQAQRLYPAKDWLRAELVGDWQTDLADAVGTLMVDANNADWDARLVALAKWSRARLPPIVAPLTEAGVITRGAWRGARVFVGSNDTSTELLCANATAAGALVVKLASAGVVSLVAARARPRPPVSLYPHVLAPLCYHAAGMNACTRALDWAAARMGCELGALERLAKQSPLGANGVRFYPYLQGERAPLWDANRRAAWSGLTATSTRADMARAVYEGIAFALAEITLSLKPPSGAPAHAIGGGARSRFWMQMLADVMGRAIRVPQETGAAYGAALLAATGAGAFASLRAAARASYRLKFVVRPRAEHKRAYARAFQDFLARRDDATKAGAASPPNG